MADTYQIQGPGGVFEIQSDHQPNDHEILQAVRAYGDAVAAMEQSKLTGGDQGSAVGRFVGNAAEMLNPLSLAVGAYKLVTHPIDTTTALIGAQVNEGRTAFDLAKQGQYSRAAGHAGAAALPLFGPAAAAAGEQIRQGDIAGGVGKAVGMLAPFGVDAAMSRRAASQAATRGPLLAREATEQVAEKVLAPGNVRYKGRAAAIAPEVLQRGLKGDRTALREAAEAGMDAGAQAIDDAIVNSANGSATAIPVQPIIRDLKDRLSDLTVNGQPIEGAADKVKALQSRIGQLEQATVQHMRANGGGPFALPFSELIKVRDVNYGVADAARGYERAGNVAASDQGWAAKETGSAIRRAFATQIPDLAKANADYSFWKTLNDVLDPAIGRPKASAPSSGITGGAKVSGAVAGQIIGPKAAFVMSVVVPWLKNRASDPSWQLADASAKMQLADALKTGNYGKARSLMLTWEKYQPKATSPSGPQMQPASATTP